MEWRQAILADQRVEYFRGKDLAAHFREKPDQMLKWVSRGALSKLSDLHTPVAWAFGTIA